MAGVELKVSGIGMKRYTDREWKFVEEYLIDFNGTRAAKAAGYAVPAVMACKLLKKPYIMKAIEASRKPEEKRFKLRRRTVLEKVAASVDRNVWDLGDEKGFVVSNLRDLPRHTHAFIDGFEVTQFFGEEGEVVGQKIKIKLSPNAPDRDMAAKILGMYAPVKGEVRVGPSLDLSTIYEDRRTEPDPVRRKIEQSLREGEETER